MVIIARPYNHYWKNTLTPLKGKIKKYDYVGFDVETYGNENKFYSGGLYWYENGKEMFEYFTNKEELISAILSRRFRNKTLVATNLGFDLTSLFFNTPYWNNIRLTSRGSDILLASYKLDNNHGKIKIIDTMNFVGFGVEKLGKIIGTNKIEKPSFWKKTKSGDFKAIKPRNNEEKKELELYNKQDCKISCDFMYFLQEGINSAGGNLKITIASTSLDVWRRTFLKKNITKENFFIPEIKDFIFKGYYGGRTEVHKRGYFENVNYYDINSLYPSVMLNKFPVPQSIKNIPVPLLRFINEYEGVTECHVKVPKKLKVPLLPIKTRSGKLIFPVGEFRGVWNNVELRKALELGYDITPLKQIIYTETFYPFVDYVNTFYNKRLEYKEQSSPMELIYKLLLNSLYGKFAQKEKQKMTIDNIEFMSDEKQIELMNSLDFLDIKNNHLINIKKSEFDGLFSFPILSSYTTSYARLKMYDYINREDLIYTDTDSVVIKGELETGTALGEMKLEYHVKKGVFIKPKFYTMNYDKEDKRIKSIINVNDVKIKGVNKAGINDFNEIIIGNKVKKIKFSKLRESIRRGLNPNTKIVVDKKLDIDDNKRIWNENLKELILNKTFENSLPLEVCYKKGFNLTKEELLNIKIKEQEKEQNVITKI